MELLATLASLALTLPSAVEWEDWSFLERCQDVVLDYRLSRDPWGEKIEFRLSNRSGEKLAAGAELMLTWSDGSASDKLSCILGGIGGPLSPQDTSVYESWAPPEKEATKVWDRAASNPDPRTGQRPTVARILVKRIWVTSESYWMEQVKAHPGAAYSLTMGPSCEGCELPISWRRIGRTWDSGKKDKNVYEQRINLGAARLSTLATVQLAEEPLETVGSDLLRSQVLEARVAHATPYEMPFGKVVFVELRLCDGGFAEIRRGEDSNHQDRLILHFYSLEDARACVEAIERWRKGEE